MKKGRFWAIALLVVCAAFVLQAATAFAGVLSAPPVPVSTVDAKQDTSPDVSGNRVVWSGWDGNDYEIYLWEPGYPAPVNISKNDGEDDLVPQIDGTRVVWVGGDGSDDEIYTWVVGSQSAPLNISENDGNADRGPQVSGDRVVWFGDDGADDEIYTWTATGGRLQVTDNSVNDFGAKVSGDRIAWVNDDGFDNEVYTWKAGVFSRVTDNDGVEDEQVSLDGDRLVWSAFSVAGNQADIYTWKVGDASAQRVSKTEGSGEDDTLPQVSGDRIIWSGSRGSVADIYTWKVGDSVPANVSNTATLDESDPQISGDRAVWWADNGTTGDVFLWRVGDVSAQNLSSSATVNDLFPQISGTRVVWQADTEIYTAAVDLNTSLALTASPSAPSYGGSTTLRALLKGTDGALAGEKVVFERLSGGVWLNVGDALTGADGYAQLKVTGLKSKQTYRVQYAGTAARAAAIGSLDVFPKVKLQRTSSWKGRSRNVRYSATGYITPKHAVSDKNKIKIRAYKKGSDGKYHYVKSFTASYVAFSKTKTKYRATVKFTSKGSWAIRAYHAKDATHAETYGSWDYFKVK